MRISIPNGKVGVVIGKEGESIKYIQLQSGARIQITKDQDADPHSLTRDVELTGTSEQRSRAEQLINDVIVETDAGGLCFICCSWIECKAIRRRTVLNESS